MPHYASPDSVWTGRVDGPKPCRVHEWVQCVSQDESLPPGVGLLGFACDEGVRRNAGRPGAADGPSAFRKTFSSLPWDGRTPLYDFGDITCVGNDLELAQEDLGESIAQILRSKQDLVLVGGGHETAWGHFQGLDQACSGRIGIINFDAHFDLRPLSKDGLGSSGTPFFQIADSCKRLQREFHYCCIGIQEQGNTPSLFKTAERLGVHTISAQDVKTVSIPEIADRIAYFLKDIDHIYVSIDLDVFSAAEAPGVSAPQALGLSVWDILPLLDTIASCPQSASLDVVELNPCFDMDQRTARLAAALVHRWCLKRHSSKAKAKPSHSKTV